MDRRGVKLGAISRRIFSPRLWTDEYPSSQVWADELERLVAFAETRGQLQKVLPRLQTSRNNQRDETLNELRIAFFLSCNGFPVGAWEPPGLGGKVGEYSIRSPENRTVFIEVKSPGWESELSQGERSLGRTKLPKYVDGEGGAFANWKGLRECIGRAYPKFTATQSNLLVVADDFFVNLHHSQHQIEIALYETGAGYGGKNGCFTSALSENLGGVGVFATTVGSFAVEYKFHVFDNPFSLAITKLPASLKSLRS